MQSDNKTKVLFTNASNGDIIRAIDYCVPESVRQLKEFSQRFKGDVLYSSQEVFRFLQRNVSYKADGTDFQDIRLPGRLLKSKTGDCKSLSLFTVGVLKNLGHDCFFTYASYNPIDSTPTHVYVTTKGGIIIDVVWGKFNSEKPYFYKKFKQA